MKLKSTVLTIFIIIFLLLGCEDTRSTIFKESDLVQTTLPPHKIGMVIEVWETWRGNRYDVRFYQEEIKTNTRIFRGDDPVSKGNFLVICMREYELKEYEWFWIHK